MKDSKFRKVDMHALLGLHFKGFHVSCKTVILRNSFSLKYLLISLSATFELIAAEPCRVMSVYGSKIQDIKRKCNENFIEYFSNSKNGMAKCVTTQIFFQQFQILRYSKIKKLWCIVNHLSK